MHDVNRPRASNAGVAMSAYAKATDSCLGTQRKATLANLLVDLGHYADAHDIDFFTTAQEALAVFAAERAKPCDMSYTCSAIITIQEDIA